MKKSIIAALLLFPSLVFAAPSSVDRIVDHIEPLIKTDFIKAQYFYATSTTASSSFPRLISSNATITNATATDLYVSGTVNLFGNIADQLSDWCVAITGSAALCDGDDATGGAGTGSNWSFTALQDAIRPTTTVGIVVNGASSTINRLITNNSTSTNLHVSGETKLATSFSGILKAASGIVSVAVNGVDYIGTAFRDWNIVSGALTPTTTVGIIVNASSTIDRLTTNNGTTTNATSTNLAVSGDMFFNGVRSATWAGFCTTITGSAALCDGDDATGGGGGTGSNWLFSALQDAIRPSTTVGIIVNGASSTLQNVTMVNSTSTNATTTNLHVSDRLNLTNALAVSNGGTGLTTFGGVNHVLYTTAAGALSSESAFTYTPGTNTLGVEKLSVTGTSGSVQHTASVDGGEYNYFVDTTGTLAFYGSAGATLNLRLLDGSLTISALSDGLLKTTTGLVGTAIPGVDYLSSSFRDWQVSGGSLIPTSTIGITVQSSSTIQGLTMSRSTTTNATTTSLNVLTELKIASITGILKAASGVVSQAIDGVDFLSPNFRDWSVSNTYLVPTTTRGLLVQAASSTINGLTMAVSTTTSATTTNLSIGGGLTFNGVTGDQWTDFCVTITGSADLCDGNDGGGGGGAQMLATSTAEATTQIPYWTSTAGTPATLSGGENVFAYDSILNKLSVPYASTTDIGATGNIFVSGASSSIRALTVETATTTRATTTDLYVSGETKIATTISGILKATAGVVSQAIDGVDYIGTAFRDWNVVSGALRPTTTSMGIIVLASSTIDRLTVLNGTTTNATSTNLNVATELKVPGLTSALILAGTGGIFGEYGGSTCTNQVTEDLAAAGTSNCVSINNDYWSGTDLTVGNGGTGVSTFTTSQVLYGNAANPVASIATGTVSAGTGITISATIYALLNAASIAIDQAANLVWTGAHDFGGATSVELPNGASPTVNAIGEVALDTTSGNLVLATSTDSTSIVIGSATTTLYAFVVASSSPDFASGGVIKLPTYFLGQVATAIICVVDGGTSQVINLDDGTNNTDTVTCTTTETQYRLTSNNSWNAYEAINLEFGAKTGSPDYITIRVIGYRKTD